MRQKICGEQQEAVSLQLFLTLRGGEREREERGGERERERGRERGGEREKERERIED